jgi:3,4-dihydroxy 2-butanone 4-phosphate synthase/GTP cyclohydrolase II
MPLSNIEDAIKDIQDGKMVIIVDDEDRENEGDLAIAAEFTTPEIITFMATHGKGLICMPIIGQRLEHLDIPLMVPENTARLGTAFTVSIDTKTDGATTGISAYDRAATIKAVLEPTTRPEDLQKPGHIFPLRYAEGGVLVRAGQTEGSVDLAKLAGLYPAAVICEVMNNDGTMARMPELETLSEKYDIKIVSVEQIIQYRHLTDKMIAKVAETNLPTKYGDFKSIAFRSLTDADEHVALVKGDLTSAESIPLVRVHSQCLTGDTFQSLRCDCGEQMEKSLEQISNSESGVFLYMRQEGRGIGLHNKLKAYELQDKGLDTVDANIKLGFPPDLRWYGIGAQILSSLGITKMKLLTNNPKKVIGLNSYGIDIVEQVPIIIESNSKNKQYLETKRTRLGHSL